MFRNVNLKEALEKERELLKDPAVSRFVFSVFDILNEEVYDEHQIRRRLRQQNVEQSLVFSHFLEEERIFNRGEIRQLCIKYRLRFLDTRHFKSELPYEAVRKIKHLEADTGFRFDDFCMIAPAQMFELKDCADDPLLFASLGGDRYYLIHQWGDDLSWSRKLKAFPFRNKVTMALSVGSIALLMSIFIPTAFIKQTVLTDATMARVAFFTWMLALIVAGVAYLGMRRFKGFSERNWNREFI